MGRGEKKKKKEALSTYDSFRRFIRGQEAKAKKAERAKRNLLRQRKSCQA